MLLAGLARGQAPAAGLAAMTAAPSLLDALSGAVTATWSGIAHAASTDWVAVYCVGAPESEFGAWSYVTQCTGGGWAGGGCSMPFQLTYGGCDVELRYYRDPAPYTLAATSNAVHWAPGGGNGTDIRHVRIAYGRAPQSQMWLSWTSDDGLTPGVVQLGTAPGAYDLPNVTAARPATYSAADTCGATAAYPGFFLHAFLDGLAPGTRYYARPSQGASVGAETSFVTGKPRGPAVDTRFVVYADMYISADTGAAATAAHVAALPVDDVDFVCHVGDLGYGIGDTAVWNEWMALIAGYSGRWPYHVSLGNHEFDYA